MASDFEGERDVGPNQPEGDNVETSGETNKRWERSDPVILILQRLTTRFPTRSDGKAIPER